MNQLLLTASKLRRLALVIVGLALFGAIFMPTAAYASGGEEAAPTYVAPTYVAPTYHAPVSPGKGGYWQPPKQQYHKPQYHKQPVYKQPVYHHCPHTYVVRKGDTLSALARHYNTTVHALAQANGIKNPNKITVGQKLCVPNASTPPVVSPPVSYCKYHTVKHGDTLTSLAKRYNTTVHRIINDNKLKGPHYLHSGQLLCIC